MAGKSNRAGLRPYTTQIVITGLMATAPMIASPAPAAEIDSEHLFGFTEGSDIGKAGDKELEVEGGGRLGKRNGSYSAIGGGVEANSPSPTTSVCPPVCTLHTSIFPMFPASRTAGRSPMRQSRWK